ncbi:MAG: patatin-like phospholipase family protein [Candidatus Omnitrophica bacterium]|nr:patatin-like phospholipase family protein [Candidatus Omnitrophota bacterium]
MLFDLRRRKRKVTLVLGGGSARGVAHIGVLSVLEREKIPIAGIIGTSMGSLVGAAYSVGQSIREMEEKAYKFTANMLLDPTIPRIGLLAGDKLEASIRDLIKDKGFGDCRIPVAVVTTDIQTGEEIVYTSGDLIKVIRASCSWPGIFNPVRVDGKLLVDGGIKNSVPTKIARAQNADYILAVDVGFCVKKGGIKNIFQMILQSFQITGEELNKYQSLEADLVIKVDLGDLDQVAFERSREAIEKGEQAAELMIGRLKKDIGL